MTGDFTDWSDAEQAALLSLITSQGPLKTGLEKFLTALAAEHKSVCAACMSTVPRNPELAADHAAKAQMLDEFWGTLTDVIAGERRAS